MLVIVAGLAAFGGWAVWAWWPRWSGDCPFGVCGGDLLTTEEIRRLTIYDSDRLLIVEDDHVAFYPVAVPPRYGALMKDLSARNDVYKYVGFTPQIDIYYAGENGACYVRMTHMVISSDADAMIAAIKADFVETYGRDPDMDQTHFAKPEAGQERFMNFLWDFRDATPPRALVLIWLNAEDRQHPELHDFEFDRITDITVRFVFATHADCRDYSADMAQTLEALLDVPDDFEGAR